MTVITYETYEVVKGISTFGSILLALWSGIYVALWYFKKKVRFKLVPSDEDPEMWPLMSSIFVVLPTVLQYYIHGSDYGSTENSFGFIAACTGMAILGCIALLLKLMKLREKIEGDDEK